MDLQEKYDQLQSKYACLLGTMKGIAVLYKYGLETAVLNEVLAAIAKAEGAKP